MTTATQRTWYDALATLVDELRRLDLKIHNDTHLEPAPSSSPDQIHTSLWSKTRITSQGALLAELEYSGCFRLWHRGSDHGPAPGRPELTASAGHEAGPAPAR